MSDLIDRQTAIDMIEKYFDGLPIAVHHDMLAMIHSLPSAHPERCVDCENFSKTRLLIPQPKRKTGKWIETDSHEPCWFKCDQCGRLSDIKEIYCPTCGASMANTTCGADMRGEGHE